MELNLTVRRTMRRGMRDWLALFTNSMNSLEQAYIKAKEATHLAERECSLADGRGEPHEVVAALQQKVDAAWKARRAAFDAWMKDEMNKPLEPYVSSRRTSRR